MVSKLILGTLAAVGVGAGFALAGPPRSPAPSLSSAVELEQLYHNQVALTAQESHLQQLLGFARAELSRPAAPAPARSCGTAGGVDRVARLVGAVRARCRATSVALDLGPAAGRPSGSSADDHHDPATTTPTSADDHDDGAATHDDDNHSAHHDDDEAARR